MDMKHVEQYYSYMQYWLIRTLCLLSTNYSTQVENPPQQDYASNDALYSLVVSVNSSQSRVFEVYIDAYLRNTALKVK